MNDRWPQEYVENSQHIGLSRTLLDDIEQRTGLKFIYVPPQEALINPPMMISALNANLLTEEERKRWLWTFPWANIMPMIVGKHDSIRLRTLKQLEGQRVSIVEGSDYEQWVSKNFPSIHIVAKQNVLDALKAVDDGESDAAIASALVVIPILQRHYVNRLAISAQIPEMLTDLRIAINPDYPELQSILNESMENISAAAAQKILTRWVYLMDIGTPGWGVILSHYRNELLISGVLIVLLLFSLRRAMLAQRQAQRSEQHKTDFLNMMSHEIRTPMNAIIAALELLRQSKQSEKRQEYVELAVSSSLDLLELLNSVLDHTKITQQQLELQYSPCEIEPLVEALCDSQRPAAQRKGLSLNLEFAPQLSTRWVYLDSHRVRQIINNLLSNAIKFTHQGEVTLVVDADDRLGELHTLHFSVRDSGIGISEEAQRRLFNAWQQGSENMELQANGSGLGLYICRSLTTLMKGTITLHSEPGSGTQVDVVIPVEECAAPVTEEQANLAIPQFNQRLSVLLVEDHHANRQLLGEQLALMSCHYEMVEDGETALARLEDENYYDIILLDCGLPGMDGYQTAQAIRSLEQRTQREATAIIAISALNSEAHIARCHESGMDELLTKPIRLNQLAGLLRRRFSVEDEVRLAAPLTPNKPDDEIINWLGEDVKGFQQAMLRQDLPEMIYFIHRITGVAQMYALTDLASFAGQLEQRLREHPSPEQWHDKDWLQQLRQLSPSSENNAS
ncbi:ATP-binding protein [Pantoea sp. USHLN256]|uniref:ATP-binding protein n=1 Tax=Pantoea sp. USHLN256 TaxID=3081293 RepID=UPI003015C4E5